MKIKQSYRSRDVGNKNITGTNHKYNYENWMCLMATSTIIPHFITFLKLHILNYIFTEDLWYWKTDWYLLIFKAFANSCCSSSWFTYFKFSFERIHKSMFLKSRANLDLLFKISFFLIPTWSDLLSSAAST